MAFDGKQIKIASVPLTKLANAVLRADGTVALTGPQSAGGQRITSLGAPTATSDAARLLDIQTSSQPVTLQFWIDIAASEGVGDGSQANPWGPIEGLEKVRLATLLYSAIDLCDVRVVGAGSFSPPTTPFDMDRFGAMGKMWIYGVDTVDAVASITLAAGTTTSRLVLSAPVAGGINQYRTACFEVLTGTAAGHKRLIRGHQVKLSVSLAAAANITLSGHQVVDGTNTSTLASAARVGVFGQTDPIENGIYYARSGAWQRAGNANKALSLEDAQVTVTGGSTLAGTVWYQTASNPTPGTHAQTWSQSDTVLTPAHTVTGIAAGDTIRIFRPAATLALVNGANRITQGGTQAIQPSHWIHAGIAFLNLSINGSGASPSSFYCWNSTSFFGCHFGALALPLIQAGSTVGFGSSGVDAPTGETASQMFGWGSSLSTTGNSGSMSVLEDGFASGWFNALGGVAIGHENVLAKVQHSGGMLGVVADGTGGSVSLRSGTYQFQPSIPVVLEGAIAARNIAYVANISSTAILCNPLAGPVADIREGALLQSRGGIVGHGTSYGLLVWGGGRVVWNSTTCNVTGDLSDIRTRTKSASAAWFVSDVNAFIADRDGSAILRFNGPTIDLETNRLTVILDKDLTAPPVTYADGDAWYVASGATGAWLNQAGKIAIANGSSAAPHPITPFVFSQLLAAESSRFGASAVWVVDEQKFYVRGTSGLIGLPTLLGGTFTGALRQTPATFTYAAARNIDTSANNNHQQTDTVTGTMAVTLTNGVDGDEGTIATVQDGLGSHAVTFAAAGRTVLYTGPSIVGQSPGQLTLTGYKFATIGGVPYLLVTNAATAA